MFTRSGTMAKKFEWKSDWKCGCGGSTGAGYGLGFIGALVYYLMSATSIWAALIGIVKAIFWPGVVVYGLLKFLGM
jgi:hypothetical protein